MTKKTPIILGAGMAGLLAACTQFQTSTIYEAQSKDNLRRHKALLRFRSGAIGDALGMEFKKVKVHKAIWFDGAFHQPNPKLCNMYSQKVVNSIQDRSIWNIDTCDRWIAPEDFHDQLIERCEARIQWQRTINYDGSWHRPIISTVPMNCPANKNSSYAFARDDIPDFKSNKIFVKRWRIPNCNTHQTIYFPDSEHGLYRASITGDVLTAEYAWESSDSDSEIEISDAFYVPLNINWIIDDSQQQLGKISPIDEKWRKQFIFDLSQKYGVYSLGRFATWRSILLDDVLQDINVIKKLINSSGYEAAKVNSNVK